VEFAHINGPLMEPRDPKVGINSRDVFLSAKESLLNH